MVVIVIEKASEKLRGELTRWLMEARPGTFVGTVNAVVREKLWNKIYEDYNLNGAIMFYNSNTEQGFEMKMCGEPRRRVINVGGVQLIEVTEKT